MITVKSNNGFGTRENSVDALISQDNALNDRNGINARIVDVPLCVCLGHGIKNVMTRVGLKLNALDHHFLERDRLTRALFFDCSHRVRDADPSFSMVSRKHGTLPRIS